MSDSNPVTPQPAPVPLTDEELGEIKRLADAATPGPWISDGTEIHGAYEVPSDICGQEIWHRRVDDSGEFVWIAETCALRADDDANAAFIAAARTAVPALIAEVESSRAEVAALRAKVAAIEALAESLGVVGHRSTCALVDRDVACDCGAESIPRDRLRSALAAGEDG